MLMRSTTENVMVMLIKIATAMLIMVIRIDKPFVRANFRFRG